MERRSYAFGEVIETVGVRRNQLVRWTDTGTIRPDLGGAGSSGKHRQFSFRNLVQVAVAGVLDGAGYGLADIARILKHLDRESEDFGGTSVWTELRSRRGRRRWRFLVETWGVPESLPENALVGLYWDSRGREHEFRIAGRNVMETVFTNAKGIAAQVSRGYGSVVVNLGDIVTELEKRTYGDTLGG